MAQKNAHLNIRINPELKREAEILYGSFGLTLSDAVNMFFSKSLMENGLPFELKIPNAETVSAIEEGRRLMSDKKAISYTDMDSLWRALNE